MTMALGESAGELDNGRHVRGLPFLLQKKEVATVVTALATVSSGFQINMTFCGTATHCLKSQALSNEEKVN